MADLNTATLERLRGLNVSALATCLFKRGFRNTSMNGIVPVSPTASRMVGPAFTLRLIPSREDLASAMASCPSRQHVQRRAFEECPPGHVLVIDSRGDARASSAGDTLIGRLQARGAVGIVSDGGFRDTLDIAALGFPVFHQRPAPLPGPVHLLPADLNLPVGCAGVSVHPGDVVVGDIEGVVVIPAHLATEIAEEAHALTLYETFAAEKVREGHSVYSLYPLAEELRSEYAAWEARQSQRS